MLESMFSLRSVTVKRVTSRIQFCPVRVELDGGFWNVVSYQVLSHFSHSWFQEIRPSSANPETFTYFSSSVCLYGVM